uniref:Uncharacterized protein n=1 Tax=Tetradesmus obliquus TaxID=3088 RepID=A0A383WED1_TETOB|eukprot:jgi/Sobl393_1/18688/SZX75967.1
MGALQPAAARISSKAAAQHNSTFNTCNTGTSRLRLANVEQLPAGCRPGHSGMGAAVLDCFRTSKVTVKDCRVNIKPKAKSKASKLPAVCKLLHAQGRLNGPSNATLLGVLSEAQLVKYAAEHPEELAGSNATKLQQQLLSNLALLFGRAVLRSKSNCTKAAAGSSSSSDYQGRRHHAQPKRHPAPKPAPLPTPAPPAAAGPVAAPAGTSPAPAAAAAPAAGAPTAAAAADSTAANTSAVQQGQQSAAAAGGTASNASSAAAAAPAPAAAVAVAAAANASSPAPAAPTPAPAQPADAAPASPAPSNSSSNSSSSSSSPATTPGGRRKLLRQQRRLQHQQQLRRLLASADDEDGSDEETAPAAQLAAAVNIEGSGAVAKVNAEGSEAMDASLLKFSTNPAVPAAAPPRPVETAGGASGDSASSGVDCNDTHTADGDADADADVAAAAAAAAAVGKAPAKLYRQGSSLILQTHASCQFQFAVTKNVGVLQPNGSSLSSSSSSSSKGSSAVAAGAHSSRPASKAAAAAAGPPQGWYLPSWVVFTAVSVVMGVLVCVMAARLVVRVRERQLLRQQRRLQHQQQLRRLLASADDEDGSDEETAPAAQLAAAVNIEGSGAVAKVNAEGSEAMDASLLKFSTNPAVPAAAPPRPVETAGGASGDSASSGVDCNDTHTADGDADADADVAAAAAAAAAVGKAPAKLYRQGSSLILQTHASCQFQFAVTKNVGVLQPNGSSLSSSSSSSSKGSSAVAAGAHSSRPASKAAAAAAGPPQGWYLPSWVVFTAVSVVMGVLVCVMAARLVVRVRERQDYSVLQTQEVPVELATGPFPSSAARPSQPSAAAAAAAAAAGQQDAGGTQQLQLPISSRAAGSRPGSRPGSSSGMKLGAAAAAAAGTAADVADDGRGGRDAAQSQDTDFGDSRQLLRGQVRSDGGMPRSSSRGQSLSGAGAAAGKQR